MLAQEVGALVIKPDGLSSVPGEPQSVRKELTPINCPRTHVLWFACAMAIQSYTYTHTTIKNNAGSGWLSGERCWHVAMPT